MRRITVLAVFVLSGCTTVGTLPDPVADNERSVLGALQKARSEMDDGVVELERLSTANDSSGVTRSMFEVARRDTLYRKLLSLRRELDSGVPAASAARVNLKSKPAILDISPVPTFEPFKDGRTFMLQGYVIHRFSGTSRVIVIPAGFVTDLASVPDVAEQLLPRNGEYSTAAIVHDYLYWMQQCTREQSDNLMAIVMKETGVAPWKALLIFGAVRLGGQLAWDHDRDNKSNGVVRIVDMPWNRAPQQLDWDAFQSSLQALHLPPVEAPQISTQVCALGNDNPFLSLVDVR